MQLPDEAISYQYQSLLVPVLEEWTPAAEARAQHFLPPGKLKELEPRLMQVRGKIATERELKAPPPELAPLDAGFIDLPQKTLDQHRRQGEASVLGRVLDLSGRLREEVDRVVILGIGGSYLGARTLFEALRSAHHNELPAKDRQHNPRIYFEGNNVDNDALQELLDLLQLTCVEPDNRDERWGVVVISKSGSTIETAAAYRIIQREMAEYYGLHSPRLQELVIPITGTIGKLRELCKADGIRDEDILTIPDDVGGRYSVFTPAGLVPAALMGLDVRALLLGAASMSKKFLDEPFERNAIQTVRLVGYRLAADGG